MELKPEMLPHVVERLGALADETRIRLLLRLQQGQANVTQLVGELGIAQASVSKHLGLLKRAGLVDVKRQGAQSIYFIKDESVFEMCKIVCDGVLRHLREQHAALGLDQPSRRGK